MDAIEVAISIALLGIAATVVVIVASLAAR